MQKPGQDSLVRYFTGESDPSEEELITIYLAMDIDKEYVASCLKEAIEKMKDETLPGWTDSDKIRLWGEFQIRKVQQQEIPVKKTFSWPRIAVAAAILICASFGWFYYKSSIAVHPAIVKNKVLPVKTDHSPGGNKAILTLADGRTIDLNATQNGIVATQGEIAILKSEEGELTYAANDVKVSINAINLLTTPRGGQYKLKLPDGTMVWLNAASSIKYPVQFSGKRREVTLTGEAYFEVAKNVKMPFSVKLNKMDVEVLGTHFNIMAYDDEPSVRTTLLEGSVRLSSANSSQMLKPGQEGILDGSNFIVKSADTEQAMSWKNGQFMFTNENIASISRKLSRWYDIQVADQRQDKSLTYTGSISKYKNVSEVLKMLELTGTLRYRIENGKITVM